ncbi:PTS sugar transporter subunit IIA [Bifidobacterium stellenboschense]|uniref:PTS system glucose subfamily transporter subunit IIA n=1 Tax=Bifidobacterium stellenboschense TaxID=762211 RepID=A0A087DT39_9BIFI|nr:PTS glucose transporter subunit IIA [Bifidobacterium stellenboschense]KFI98689.1 PTS system glucose subfamily transporter subunit IIA [Bifidobacterium stellenboschense]
MGLFSNLFHKPEATESDSPAPITIVAPVDGTIEPVEEVPDETFAAKILGDGFGVVPTSGTVVAPVSGTVTTVANAKHAVGITTEGGVEVLVHIGVDTVQLKGEPFDMLVAEGQTVTAGKPIERVDLEAVKAAGKPTDVIVVFTNPAAIASLDVDKVGRTVATGQKLGTMTTK